MRTVDRYGIEVTTAPTNPSTTIEEIDGTPTIAAHTLQSAANDGVTDLGFGRALLVTAAGAGISIGGKLRLSGGFQ